MSRRPRRADRQPIDRDGATAPLEGRLVGYRLVRRIASGDRADVYLAAAEVPEPADRPGAGGRGGADLADVERAMPALVVLRVYDADVPEASIAREIEAMSTDAAGALPALHDVASLADGRCCVVVERIGGGSVARLLSTRTISAGEAVTILAPIVVAVADLAQRGFVHTRLAASDILFDDVGRPRLIGLGSLQRIPAHGGDRTGLVRSAHERLADLIEDVGAAVMPGGALDDAVDLIRSRLAARPFSPCEADLERRLFGLATPEPVRGIDVRERPRRLPARVPTFAEHPDAGAPVDTSPSEVRPGAIGSGLRRLLSLAQAPEDIVDRLAATADVDRVASGRRRLAEAVRARGRSMTFGALVGGAALVSLLTLVPPATADDVPSQAADPVSPTTTGAGGETGDPSADEPAAPEPTATPDPSGGPVDQVPDDPVAAARELLERRAQCFAALDLDCLGSVDQPGSAIETADRNALVAAREGAELPAMGLDPDTIEIAAEMGAAVLVRARVAPEREPASLLMVRGEAGWRLREVFG